jgi:hypothetical protein
MAESGGTRTVRGIGVVPRSAPPSGPCWLPGRLRRWDPSGLQAAGFTALARALSGQAGRRAGALWPGLSCSTTRLPPLRCPTHQAPPVTLRWPQRTCRDCCRNTADTPGGTPRKGAGTSLVRALALHGVARHCIRDNSVPTGLSRPANTVRLRSHLASPLRPGRGVLIRSVSRRLGSVACVREDASPNEVSLFNRLRGYLVAAAQCQFGAGQPRRRTEFAAAQVRICRAVSQAARRPPAGASRLAAWPRARRRP